MYVFHTKILQEMLIFCEHFTLKASLKWDGLRISDFKILKKWLTYFNTFLYRYIDTYFFSNLKCGR